jgi:ribosomal protein L11 methylase PrmA
MPLPAGKVTALLVAALALGLLSSALSARPYVAVVEWSVYCLMALLILSARATRPLMVETTAALIGSIVPAAYVTGVMANYVSALLLDFPVGAETLLVGFSNPRFPAQLQVLTIPLLPLALQRAPTTFWRVCLGIVAALWWMCFIGSGSRTGWIAILFAAVVIPFFGWGRAAVVEMAISVCRDGRGAVESSFLRTARATVVNGRAGDRALFRLRIGRRALENCGESASIRRWRIRFSASVRCTSLTSKTTAAHPHNFWLQLVAEWGIPATLLIGAAAARILRSPLAGNEAESTLEARRRGHGCAVLAWGIGTLSDGYMVIPTSQMMSTAVFMLAVMWLRLSSPPHVPQLAGPYCPATCSRLCAVALSVLAVLPFTDFGQPTAREQTWRSERPGAVMWPRFWQQGWIGPDNDVTARGEAERLNVNDRHPASFRDPAGRVILDRGKVIRALHSTGCERFEAYRASGFQTRAEASGWVVRTRSCSVPQHLQAHYSGALEHERVEFISYPFEWPFALLKAAAQFHLTLNICALEHGLKMVDASAYNVQFRGVDPIFVDVLSFAPYVENEPWIAHSQYCEQFLNPLLLASSTSVPFHSLYRGALEGVSADTVSGVLSPFSWFSPDALVHVHLPARAARSARKKTCESLSRLRNSVVPKSTVLWLMKRLLRWIGRLEPKCSGGTTWASYRSDRSAYSRDDDVRGELVKRFVVENRIRSLLDVGCNDGQYSEFAVRAGATSVVAIDSDHGALQACFDRASKNALPVLPLFQDWCSQSPQQGWALRERSSFDQRVSTNGLLAFAVLHHLCLGRNIPIGEAVESLVKAAPRGLIEFVPADDERARVVTALKGDVATYDRRAFLEGLKAVAKIIRVTDLPDTSRCIVEYVRA